MNLSWLTHNLLIKAGAFILAVSLWFYVAGEETVEANLKIPIQVTLISSMVVTEQDVTSISVGIRGRKEAISRLSENELVCKIDFTSCKETQTINYAINSKSLPLPSDIKILEINPESIVVKIDRMVQKVMPVRVVTSGEPAPGYRVGGFFIDPISALIKGPENYLKDKVYIDTEPVDVTGRQKSFKKMVPLVPIPMVGQKEPPQFVEVVVKIEEIPVKNKK